MRRARGLALCAVLLCAVHAWAEDSVVLKNGKEYRGRIEREERGWLGIQTSDGLVWIKHDEIETLVRASAEKQEPRREPAPAPAPAPAESQSQSQREKPEKPAPSPDAGSGDAQRRDAGERPAEERPIPIGEPGVRTKTVEEPQLPPPVAPAKPGGSPETDARVFDVYVGALGGTDAKKREVAEAWLFENWPSSKDVLVAALETGGERGRVECVRLLDDERITDPRALVLSKLADQSAAVRATALRVARHRKLKDLEERVIDLMRKDPEWIVRQEAVRALEDLGSSQCLTHVLAGWSREQDPDRRRKYVRVLRTLLGTDLGDDEDAWRQAVDEVFLGRRNLAR